MNLPIIVIGAGGHAAVVADALLAAGASVLGYLDAAAQSSGHGPCGLPVLGTDDVLRSYAPDAVVLVNGIGGIGEGEPIRRRAQEHLSSHGWKFVEVRHPSAVVSRFARIGTGAQMLAGSIVQAGAQVGDGCIVNTAAVVEHDVVLGAWTHVAPRALVCGGVFVGAGSHVGAGAVIRQGVTLGQRVLVGAGAVVVGDFGEGCVVAGVPARRMEHKP